MDWLRQIPIGQYVDGTGSWLVRLDPRLKLAWTLAFLLTPILAGSWWRLALVGLLLLLTAASGLPWRIWRRTLPLLIALSLLVGLLAALLPAGDVAAGQLSRPPQELRLAPEQRGLRWEVPATDAAESVEHALTLLAARHFDQPPRILIAGSLFLAAHVLAANGSRID